MPIDELSLAPCAHLLDLRLILGLLYPRASLSIVPTTVPGFAFHIVVNTHSLLLSIFPISIVLATVWPREEAVPLLFVVEVVAFVSSAIGPGEHAFSVHLVIGPLAVEHASISPRVGALPVDVVVDEVAAVA